MKFARPVNDKTPRVTQAFSRTHPGVDYGYREGTPLYASEAGRIIIAKDGETRQWLANTPSDPYKPATGRRRLRTEDYGNFVRIDHGDGFATLYAHQKVLSIIVKPGDRVEKGQKIGEIGSTGNSSGNHTHWEIRKNNKAVNPEPLMDTEFSGYFEKKEGENMQEIIDQLREERDRNWNLFQEARKSLEDKSVELQNREEQVRRLNKTLDALTQETEEDDTTVALLRKQLDELGSEVGRLKEENARLRKDHSEITVSELLALLIGKVL